MGQRKTALLLGAYGQSNLGDDLLLHNYVQLLSKRGFTEIYVNAAEAGLVPAVILDGCKGIKIFEAYNTSARALLGLIRKADCIVYGGGTVYKELYGTTGRSPYPLLIRLVVFNTLCRIFRKPIYNLHIGIGSIKTAFGRQLSRWALRACTNTVFRDEKSYLYAKKTLKLPAKHLSHSTDGLFINPDWQQVWHTIDLDVPAKKGALGKKVIGINVLSDIPDWVDREHYLRTMVAFLNDLLKKGHYIVFMPFQTSFNPHNDLDFIKKEILPHLKHGSNFHVAANLALDNSISCLRQIDVLIGMRFHSLLLATAIQTPFVAIAYDTKCVRFAEEANYPHVIKLEELTLPAIQKSLQEVLKDKQALKKQLKKTATEQYNEAGECIRNLHF